MTTRIPVSRFTWTTGLDNYEPPRAWSHGVGEVFAATAALPETVTLTSSDFPFTTHTIFLLDDGVTVRPFYVAGMKDGVVHVQPYVADRGWALGPRRAYHVKMRTES